MKTIGTIFLLLALPFLAPAQTNVPTGKVVWWVSGRAEPNFLHRYYFSDANGVIENDGEIVTNIVAISANILQALALTSDGKVLDFGFNPNGEDQIRPELSNIVSVVAERNASWVVRHEGTAAMLGSDKDQAKVIDNLSNVVSVTWAGGMNYYLALKNDGTVLGIRLDNPAIQQVRVHGQILSNVLALAAMGYTPLVLKTDGTVLCLGYQTPGAPPVKPRFEMHDGNLWEYLGGESEYLPYQYASADPVIVRGRPLTNIVALSSEEGHALALKTDGTVVGWQMNWGTYSFDAASTPAGLGNAIAIAGGNMALKRDGTVISWGNDGVETKDIPSGLSNVVAIAEGGGFGLAITTGNIPSSIFVRPHGRLEEMAREADLIFKGQVISNAKITNMNFRMFRSSMIADSTEFKVISTLKGGYLTNIVLQHFSGCEWSDGFHDPPPPAYYKFEPGQSYLVFAAKGAKTNSEYFMSANTLRISDDFWQLPYFRSSGADGVIHTLDARPINGLSYNEAYWYELNRLLNDVNPTNQLFAIDKLDCMSTVEGFEKWRYGVAFNRQKVLNMLFPLTTNSNKQVAARASSCFPNQIKK
jgi:hypothetical protein